MSQNDSTRLIASATRRGLGRRPVNPPLERASTMLSDRVGDMRDDTLGPLYGLDGTSAARALRAAVADLERASDAWLTPSGLAAVTAPLLALLHPGDEVLATDAVYGPTRRFLTRYLRDRGVRARFHPAAGGVDDILSMLTPATRVLLIESPASLTFEMVDAPALARVCRERGIVTVMDNTWAAGLAFKPLAHDVDVSVQALTKYASGHSDVLMGSICAATPALHKKIGEVIEDLGWHVSPDDAWLALRGLRTLPLRYERQSRSAHRIARWLSQRSEVAAVLHPAMPDHPGHAIWRRDYSGSAGLMGVVLKSGGRDDAHRLLDALTLFGLGYSWGGFESLATWETPQLEWRRHPPGFPGPLLRLHVGLEDADDLIADLDQAFAALNA